jgi:NAD(P)-dependent dehydrogenase (short-subunit alcohol dehydrogenase family)
MEGKLNDAFKTGAHPHTNMAKAALNMITRTCAGRLAEAGIFLNSVDTGWVTNNAPYPAARAMEGRGFQPPLDEIDGAARVCDPIFTGLNTGHFVHGKFLKDYRAVAW